MLAGGTGDQNLCEPVQIDASVDAMLARVRSLLVFSVENKGTKIDTSSGVKKADVMMDRWKSIFSKYDSNGSGTLHIEDVERMVRRDLKIPKRLVSEEQIVALFHHLDLDGGGTIDFFEFLNFVQQPSSRGTVSEQDVLNSVARAVRLALRRNKIRVRDLEEDFQHFEQSGTSMTGELGPNDMVRFFRKILKLTKHECTDKALHVSFTAIDDDGNGKMGKEEFLEFIKYCSLEPSQKVLHTRVPGLIGGMRGQLPVRMPTRRPGTFRGTPLSHTPFCFNGRDFEAAGRLARSTRCNSSLARTVSDLGSLTSVENRQVSFTVSRQLSTTSLRETAPERCYVDDGLPAVDDGYAERKRVWSGHLPGKTCQIGYQFKGAHALNKVEERLFAAGIDVRGQYHKLGRPSTGQGQRPLKPAAQTRPCTR